MKNIKFISNDRQQNKFAIAVRKNVNNYFREKGISTKGNLQMTIKTITMLSIYIVPFVLILSLSHKRRRHVYVGICGSS
jgi:hypothetical protein